MDAAALTQVVTALTVIAKIVDSLGVGGVIVLSLAGPVIVVLAVMVLSYLNGVKLARIIEAYRKDADTRFEAYRENSEKRFEEYRTHTDKVLTKYGEALGKVTDYYENNVELVKGYERMAKDFAGVLSLNSATMQALVDKIQTVIECLKETARGAS